MQKKWLTRISVVIISIVCIFLVACQGDEVSNGDMPKDDTVNVNKNQTEDDTVKDSTELSAETEGSEEDMVYEESEEDYGSEFIEEEMNEEELEEDYVDDTYLDEEETSEDSGE